MASMMDFSFESRPWQTLSNQIKNANKVDGIDLRPKYQRGYVWNNDFKDKLIYSIIRRYPIGNISLRIRRDANEKGASKEVVDGQQRLTTIFLFTNGEYSVRGEYARKIIQHIVDYMGEDDDKKTQKLRKRLDNKGSLTLKYEQLPDIVMGNINAYNISITNITNSTDDEISEYFRYLQNQEILRAGEMINSVPETALDKYIEMLENKELLLSKVSFANNRRQFDRLFYSILGLLNGDVGFGIVDKDVLNFASECEELNDIAKKQCLKIINDMNIITEDDTILVGYVKSNARYMKFLLLLSALSLVDFEKDPSAVLNNLYSVNSKLSAFSSAKADSVAKEFYGYAPEVVEELRLLALISKGGHSYARVANRMEILAYYINDIDNKIVPSGIQAI